MATEYIDLTPSWEAAARIYIMALQNGTAEGRKAATEELLRMARIADAYVGSRKVGVLKPLKANPFVYRSSGLTVNIGDIVTHNGERRVVMGWNEEATRVFLKYPGFSDNADSNKAVPPTALDMRAP